MTKAITINGVTYPNLSTALIDLNLTHLNLSDIHKVENNYGLSEGEALNFLQCKETGEEYIFPRGMNKQVKVGQKEFANSKKHYFDWYENWYNKKFNNHRQLLSFLKKECNSSFFMTPISFYAIDIIKYLIEGGLESLTYKRERVQLFEYDNVYFREPKEFFSYHGILSYVFYFNLYRTRGNISEAITISKRYIIPDGKVEFNGSTFDNCNELLRFLGLPVRALHRTLSLNLPFEKALVYTNLVYGVIRNNEVRYNGIPQTFTKLRNFIFKIWGIRIDEDLAQYILDGNNPMTVEDFENYVHALFDRLTREHK